MHTSAESRDLDLPRTLRVHHSVGPGFDDTIIVSIRSLELGGSVGVVSLSAQLETGD